MTHRVHPPVLDFLSQTFEVRANQTTETLTPGEVLTRARGADALMVFMPDRIDDAFLADCPRLRVVSGALKGSDNFDVGACSSRGIWFTVVPDLLSVPTAELAIGLLFAVTRRIVEGDREIRREPYRGWRPLLYGRSIAGLTAGILGVGGVGRHLASRLRALDMRVCGYDPKGDLPPSIDRCETVDELIDRSDVLFPLTPLTASTHHIIDRDRITRMPEGAIIVNVGRGSLVDEIAIADALESGRLGAYAADVFEMEDWARTDRPRSIPQRLVALEDRTVFTPHLGSATAEARLAIEMDAARNMVAAINGMRPPGALNDVSSI